MKIFSEVLPNVQALVKSYSTHSVVSDSLWPHGLQLTRPPCPSTPKACSNTCPLSRWCHQIISSSDVPFSSCLQSFLASGSFPMCQGPNYWSLIFSISPSNHAYYCSISQINSYGDRSRSQHAMGLHKGWLGGAMVHWVGGHQYNAPPQLVKWKNNFLKSNGYL